MYLAAVLEKLDEIGAALSAKDSAAPPRQDPEPDAGPQQVLLTEPLPAPIRQPTTRRPTGKRR